MTSEPNFGWIENADQLFKVCAEKDTLLHRAFAELCDLAIRLDRTWPPQLGEGRTRLTWVAYSHLAACFDNSSSPPRTSIAEHAYLAGETIEKIRGIVAREDEARRGRAGHEDFYRTAVRHMEQTGNRALAYEFAKAEWIQANQARVVSGRPKSKSTRGAKLRLTPPTRGAWFKVLQTRQAQRAERYWSTALTENYGKPTYALFLRLAVAQGMDKEAAQLRARARCAKLLLRVPTGA